ncbi:MAG: GDSL-type esterase/lipase family protein [Verrucomicrobiota bacterium]
MSVLSSAQAAVFVTWGDSLTFGHGGTPYPEQLGALTGITTLNRGINGETSTQIAARFLAEPALFGEHVVIWAGRNNFLEHEGVQSDIASMVSHLTTTDYLVLGLINSHDEHIGNPYYDAFTAINLDLAATYGHRYIDIHQILLNAHDPLSPIDVSDVGFGIAPASLRSDALHLNTAGYGLVAHTVADYFASVPEPAQTTWITAIGCAIAALGLRKRRA